MNDFQDKMNEKIKKYSNKEYLDGYINHEFLTNDGKIHIFLYLDSKNQLFDSRTRFMQSDLVSDIYSFIENKTEMLDSTIPIQLNIIGLELDSKEKELVRHLIKEHYAIELYKVQKKYNRYRNKMITLVSTGLLALLGYALLTIHSRNLFFLEFFSFLFSFSLWESFDSLLYTLSDIKGDRSNITQNLLLTVEFHEAEEQIKRTLEN